MRLLVVENSTKFEMDLRGGLEKISDLTIEVVRSHDDAIEKLNADEYDLILCDLRIPTAVGRLDASVEHGLAVHSHAREVARGTPVMVMSAYGTIDILKELYEASPREDPFGLAQDEPMTSFFQKSDLPELVDRVRLLAEQQSAVDQVAIHSGGADFGLSLADRRVLRLFGRRRGGVVVRLRPLGGGLSAARVIRVEVVDEHGSVVSRAVAKLASLSRATAEASQFRQYVLPQLGSGAFAHLIDEVRAGACRTGGLFYWFASGDGDEQAYELPLFALLPSEEQLAVRAIEGLKAKLRPWVAAAHQTAVRTGEVRRLLVTDSEMLEIRSELAFDLDALEERTIYVNQGPEHGDLHGLNVLVRADGDAVIIDFASTMSGPVALDPVTLELSLLFHPDSPLRRAGWPSLEQARQWTSQAAYCEGSPVADFIAECRSWAHDRAASDVEIFAVAYAYALRQLKFEGTDHDRALAIATSAIEGMESA